MNYTKIKNFCAADDTTKKKDNSHNGRKNLQIIYLIQDLYPDIQRTHITQQ